MALAKGTNSYVDVAEADAYFENRLDTAAWNLASAAQKAQALVTGTQVLDTLSWVGVAVSDLQPLAFPRTGYYFDPRLGKTVTLTAAVPMRVVQANCEMAYHLLNNDGLLDNTGSVDSISLSGISLSNVKPPERVPPVVKRAIRPLLAAGAFNNTWWRAN